MITHAASRKQYTVLLDRPERVLFCVLRRWGMQDDVDKTRAVLMHRPRHSSKYTAMRPRRTYIFSG